MAQMKKEWHDHRPRCCWADPDNPRYVRYHDEEWGVPVHDDHRLFEMLILESFQAGLSWECVLNKREAFRRAFDHFDIEQVCAYDAEKQEQRIFRDIQDSYGSFADYLWGWTAGEVIVESGISSSALSDAISADLKRRGMKFVGTTIIYAYLQAVGVIDAHEESCAWNRKNKGE